MPGADGFWAGTVTDAPADVLPSLVPTPELGEPEDDGMVTWLAWMPVSVVLATLRPSSSVFVVVLATVSATLRAGEDEPAAADGAAAPDAGDVVVADCCLVVVDFICWI